MRAYVCVCVVNVIVKRPVLLPSVVDGRSRNPLYYYYYSYGCALAFETDVGDLTRELFPAGLDIVTRIYEQREEWMALFEPSTFFHKYK